MNVTESINAFLKTLKQNRLMVDQIDPSRVEVQVNVIAGTPVEGKQKLYTDGQYDYHPIRIPHNANTIPNFRNYKLKYPLEKYALCIGSTGWNWKDRCSLWCGFDLDAIAGHAKGVGVSADELERVKVAVQKLDYVQVQKSTRGLGLHLYVYLDYIPT